MIGQLDKRIYEKGITLLEALVSTAIIGIGFVAIFQMVNYSVQSIDTSGERTKSNYLVGMVAEDLIAEKNSTSPTKDVKLTHNSPPPRFFNLFNILSISLSLQIYMSNSFIYIYIYTIVSNFV